MQKKHPYLNDYFVDEYGRRVYASATVYRTIAKRLGLQKSQKMLPLVKVAQAQDAVYIPLFTANQKHAIQAQWTLALENGERLTGKVKRNAINLPNDLPLGYHHASNCTHTGMINSTLKLALMRATKQKTANLSFQCA